MTGLGDQYECSVCHGTFTKTWSDEEAMAEMAEMWAETDDPQIVCDDCFHAVTAWARESAPEAFLRPPPPVHIPKRRQL